MSGTAFKIDDNGYVNLFDVPYTDQDRFVLDVILRKVSDLCALSYDACRRAGEDSPLKASLTEINEALVAISRVDSALCIETEVLGHTLGTVLRTGECSEAVRRRVLERQAEDYFGDRLYMSDTGRLLLDGKEASNDDISAALSDFCDEYGYNWYNMSDDVEERIRAAFSKPSAGEKVVAMKRGHPVAEALWLELAQSASPN